MRTTLPDPFELEPSTAAYVPRPATVQALARLQAAIEKDDPVVLMRGPAGIGKTLLLRLLRRRVEGRMRCVELEVASGQSAEAICMAALRALGRESEGDPAEHLARVAGEFGRAGVLLTLDRAERLAPETLRPLLDLAARCPSLQMVLAAELPHGDHAWLRSPDPRISIVELCEPMSARETLEYLRARLALAVAPVEVRKQLGWRRWPALIRGSQGNPALLHHLARRILFGDAAGEVPERLEQTAALARAGGSRWWLVGASAVGAAALIAGALVLRERAASVHRVAATRPAAARTASEPEPLAKRAEPAPEPRKPQAVLAPAPATPGEPTVEPAREAENSSAAPVAPPAAPLPAVRSAPPPPAAPVARPAPVPATLEDAAPRAAPARAPETPAPQTPVPAAREAKPPLAAPPAPPQVARPAPVVPAPAPRPVPVSRPAPAPVPTREPIPAPLGAGDALARPRVPTEAARPAAGIPVFVNAVPAARIEIDGRDVGSTPIVGLPIAPGTRSFAASFADGRRVERTIQVEGAEVYVLFP